MADVLQFYVDDTSPMISYSPFADIFSTPDLVKGWNPYFTDSGFASSQGDAGKGTSLHITALDGAALSLQWIGTGIELYGSVVNASYNITLDGNVTALDQSVLQSGMLAVFHDLPNGLHTIRLTAQITNSVAFGSLLSFNQASIISPPPSSNLNLHSQSLQDANVSFTGTWANQNQTLTVGDPGQPQLYHTSSKSGDRVRSRFIGTALTVTGAVSPSAGLYSVTIDNHTTTYSAKSSFTKLDTLLFYVTGLDGNQTHDIVIQNEEDKTLAIQASGFLVTTAQNRNDSTPPAVPSSALNSDLPRGTIAALVLGGVLGLIAIFFTLFACFIYRPRIVRRRRQQREKAAMDIVSEKKSDKDQEIVVISHVDHVTSDDDALAIHPYTHQHSSPKTNLARLIIPNSRQPSTKSNSTGRKSKGKKKAQQSSPSFTLDLASASQGSDFNGGRRPSSSRSSTGSQYSNADHPRGSQKPKLGPSPSGPGHVRQGSRRLLLESDGEGDGSEEYSDNDQVNDLPSGTTAGHGWPRTPGLDGSGRIAKNSRSSVPSTFGVHRDNDNEETQRMPVLDVRESSPFRVDFLGLPWWGGSRESAGSNTTANRAKLSKSSPLSRGSQGSGGSHASRAKNQTSGRAPSKSQKGKGIERDLEKNEDARFHTSPLETSPGESFLNLSPVSSAHSLRKQSSWRAPSGPTRSHWSESTGYSLEIPDPATVPPLPFQATNEMRDSPQSSIPNPFSPSKSSKGSRSSGQSLFPYPVSIPQTPYTPDPHPIVDAPQALQSSSSLHFVTPFRPNDPIPLESSESSGDSVPTTISDIHFQHPTSEITSTQPTLRRSTSTGSHLLPHPPLPTVLSGLHNVYSRSPSPQQAIPVNLDSEPYIVQRVLGHARSASAVTLHTPSPLGRSTPATTLTPGTSAIENQRITGSQILGPSLPIRSKSGVGPRGPRPLP